LEALNESIEVRLSSGFISWVITSGSISRLRSGWLLADHRVDHRVD
jgi:hypothetical protein